MFSREEEDTIYSLAEKLTGSTQKGSSKKTVLVQNVARRMQAVGAPHLAAYLDYAAAHQAEYQQLISALTIHFTSWFREADHFELVFKEASIAHDPEQVFRVLCAACSTGEEVYSFGLFLESKRQAQLIRDYEIIGIDIDGVSVATAQRAIYPAARVQDIPAGYRSFCYTGSGKTEGLFTLDKEIRRRTKFKQGDLRNLAGTLSPSSESTAFSAILCRNVLIYFNESGVKSIVSSLVKQLKPGGILCLGHSEAVDGAKFKLESKGRSIYKRPANVQQTLSEHAVGRVLVVDDSLVVRKVMVSLLSRAGFSTEAVDSAANATKALREGSFDLITLDLNMPEQDGASWLRAQRQMGMRVPVVIVSDSAPSAAEEVLGALANGAQDYIEKRELNEAPQKLGDRLKAIATQHIRNRTRPKTTAIKKAVDWKRTRPELILIGASTGGTDALIELLRMMPLTSPPVLVVQHITPAFAEPFAQRLAKSSGLRLGKIAQDAPIESGFVYMALGDYHIGVKRGGPSGWRLDLSYGPTEHSVRPAVDFLFRSAAGVKVKAIAAILTGMGKDGALGMRDLKNAGCLTLAQDEASCVVYGMPREAIELEAVHLVGDLKVLRAEIDQCLAALAGAA